MPWTIEALTEPTAQDLADLITLFREVPYRTCPAQNYLDYLLGCWSETAVFAVRNAEGIQGFIHVSGPTLLEPDAGWIICCRNRPCCPADSADKALQMAVDWMKAQGATRWVGKVRRHPRAFYKRFDAERSDWTLIEKEITDVA